MTLPGWNNLETATSIHKFFEIGGIIVLATLVLFESIAYIYSHRKEALTVEASASDGEKLKSRIRHLDSRELSDEEVKVLTKAVEPFKGQVFWIVTQTTDYDKRSEQMRISDQISKVLISGGWRKGTYADGGIRSPVYRRISDSGIEVASGTGANAQKAANALREVISGFSISVREPVVFSDIPPDLVHIDIGLR